MTSKIAYINIPSEISARRDLTDKQKMLLGLIQGFDPRGLCLSNADVAEVLCTTPENVSRIISGLKAKKLILIKAPQSRWRKIYFCGNEEVEEDLLPQTRPILSHSCQDTLAPVLNKKERNKERVRSLL